MHKRKHESPLGVFVDIKVNLDMKNRAVSTTTIAVGLKAVFAIFSMWECSVQQQIKILGISRSSYYKYRRVASRPILNSEQIERLSLVLNLHAYLRTLFENPQNVYGFMRMPNEHRLFNGQSPLTYISRGSLRSLKDTTHYLGAILANP